VKSKVESSSAFALAASTNNQDNPYDLLLSKDGCTSTSAIACFYEREDALIRLLQRKVERLSTFAHACFPEVLQKV
jgi:hypothetical protein